VPKQKFRPNLATNVKSKDRNSCTALRKTWLSQGRFSLSSEKWKSAVLHRITPKLVKTYKKYRQKFISTFR